jgi:hypothetical protein
MSTMLAQVIGPLMALIGLGVLFNPTTFSLMMEEMSSGKQYLVLFVTGTVTTILGLIVVLGHNVWVWDWSVLITILGWATLIKGAIMLLFPRASMGISRFYQGKTGLVVGAGVIGLVIGLVLSYYGFVVGYYYLAV